MKRKVLCKHVTHERGLEGAMGACRATIGEGAGTGAGFHSGQGPHSRSFRDMWSGNGRSLLCQKHGLPVHTHAMSHESLFAGSFVGPPAVALPCTYSLTENECLVFWHIALRATAVPEPQLVSRLEISIPFCLGITAVFRYANSNGKQTRASFNNGHPRQPTKSVESQKFNVIWPRLGSPNNQNSTMCIAARQIT